MIKIVEGGKKETFSKFFQNLTREKEEGIRSLAWKDQKFEISLALDFPRAQDPRSTRSDKWLPLAGGSRSKKKNPGFLYNPIHLWPGCSHPLLLVVVVGSRQLPLSLSLSLEEIRENFTTSSPSTNFVPLLHCLNLFREEEGERCLVSASVSFRFPPMKGDWKLIEAKNFGEVLKGRDAYRIRELI